MPRRTAGGGILRENSRFVYIGEIRTQRKTVRYNRLCKSQFSTRKAASGRQQRHSTLLLRSSATDERDRRKAISPTLWRWDLEDNYFGKWRHCRKPVIEPRRIPPQQLQRRRKKPHRTPRRIAGTAPALSNDTTQMKTEKVRQPDFFLFSHGAYKQFARKKQQSSIWPLISLIQGNHERNPVYSTTL